MDDNPLIPLRHIVPRSHAFSSNTLAVKRLLTMAALGTKMDTVRNGRGKIILELRASMREVAAKELCRGEAFAADQFHNRDALAGYETMEKELLEQIPGGLDAFCAAFRTAGTAGMAVGVAGVLKVANSATKVAVLEPWASPAITHGMGGEHDIEGIAVGFVPPVLDRGLYDEVRDDDEKYTRQMRRQLERKEGIYVGLSIGLNIIAALAQAKELGRGKNVVTVACDSAVKSLKGVRTLVRSGGMPEDLPVNAGV